MDPVVTDATLQDVYTALVNIGDLMTVVVWAIFVAVSVLVTHWIYKRLIMRLINTHWRLRL